MSWEMLVLVVVLAGIIWISLTRITEVMCREPYKGEDINDEAENIESVEKNKEENLNAEKEEAVDVTKVYDPEADWADHCSISC